LLANLHLISHFLVPFIIALSFFRSYWQLAFLIMISTIMVDLDHLLATPIYDPTRCSINFHPLHGFIPIIIYMGLCFPKKTRLIGIGLCLHMALDSIDCQVTNGVWYF